MKIANAKLQILLFVLAFLFLFSSMAYAESFTPPCEANAYLTTCNASTGAVTVDYYNNNSYACSANLTETYLGHCTEQGFTVISEMQGIEELNELIKFSLYFIFAIMLVALFVTGLRIMNT